MVVFWGMERAHGVDVERAEAAKNVKKGIQSERVVRPARFGKLALGFFPSFALAACRFS
jgi:hypothetical protein